MKAIDVLMILGLLMLSGGCYLVYPPAGLIVPGTYLVGLCSVALTRKRKP